MQFSYPLILILILSLNLNLLAQDYLAYHQQIVQAEELLVAEDFSAAHQVFVELDTTYPFVFARDYAVAAQTAVLAGQWDQSWYWVKKAVRQGAKMECLAQIELLDTLVQDPEWQQLLSDYPARRKLYLRAIEMDLASEFHRRYTQEQQHKSREGYREVVTANFNRIAELALQGTFPGDRRIGIDDSGQARGINDCDFGNSKIIPTLLHYDNAFSELTIPLMNAVRHGQLHPREFARIYDFEAGRHSILYKDTSKPAAPLPEYCFGMAFSPKCEDKERIDEDRAAWGICSQAVDKGKIALEEKYGMKLFFGYR
jgi:hypothetical protein